MQLNVCVSLFRRKEGGRWLGRGTWRGPRPPVAARAAVVPPPQLRKRFILPARSRLGPQGERGGHGVAPGRAHAKIWGVFTPRSVEMETSRGRGRRRRQELPLAGDGVGVPGETQTVSH